MAKKQLGLSFGVKPKKPAKKPAKKRGSALIEVSGYCVKPYKRRRRR